MVKGSESEKTAGIIAPAQDLAMLGASSSFHRQSGNMAIPRSSCHLLSWIHTIQMSFAGMNDIVLRIIECPNDK
jgi:hypothetical protein